MNNANKIKLAIIAFSMYFISGAGCTVVGALLSKLTVFYGKEISKVVLLLSAYAVGRVSTVYFSGKIVEKNGPLKVLFFSSLLSIIYFVLLPTIDIYYVGLLLSFIGGIGMGGQDASCPLILSEAFKENYAASLSAGQGMFCLGSFALSFLAGLSDTYNISFRYIFVLLAFISLIICIITPLTKMNLEEFKDDDTVKPLYTNNKWLAYIVSYLAIFLYCVLCNNEGTYISSYFEYLGYDFGNYILTIYNAGCLIGSFVFIIILRKVKEKTVLFINSVCGSIVLIVSEVIKNETVWFISYFVLGFFVGVLFSLIVSIITRIGYKKISLMSSLVGVIGGAGDILTPIFTGALINKFSLSFSSTIGIIVLVAISICSLFILFITREEDNYGYCK